MLEHYTTLLRTLADLVLSNDPPVNMSNLGSVSEEAHKKSDLERSRDLRVFCPTAKPLLPA